MSATDSMPPISPAAVLYRVNPTLTAEAVAAVYRSAGLRRPVDDLARIGQMLAHANLIVGAYLPAENGEEQLIGVARALTDFSYCCYLSDLAVALPYQRLGIGRRLIEEVRTAIGGGAMLLLLSAPDAMDYYPHIGFDKVQNGWIIPRQW